VIESPSWNGARGAATWGNGTVGISGTISTANSLIGGNPNDQVGTGFLTLPNGNYVVESPDWNGARGAATWGNGTTAVMSTVSDTNSLVGSNNNDRVGAGNFGGAGGFTLLSNGNYLVRSPNWNSNRGAVTWASATTGVSGVLSDVNSLVGSSPFDVVGGDSQG